MDYLSFLRAVKTSGVYLTESAKVGKRLARSLFWQDTFVALTSGAHAAPGQLLFPATYGADQWPQTAERLKAVMQAHQFSGEFIGMLLGNVMRRSNVILLSIKIVEVVTGPGTVVAVSFKAESDFRVLSEEVIGKAINGIEADALMTSFDVATGFGRYQIVDTETSFAKGDVLPVAVEADVEALRELDDAAFSQDMDTLAQLVEIAARHERDQRAGLPLELPAPDVVLPHPALADASKPGRGTRCPGPARVQLSADKDLILISAESEIAAYQWKPKYDGVRRLAVQTVDLDGITRHCLVSGSDLGHEKKVVAECDSEAAAVELLRQVELGEMVSDRLIPSRAVEPAHLAMPPSPIPALPLVEPTSIAPSALPPVPIPLTPTALQPVMAARMGAKP